ncbi:MAG: hypothetical protein HQL49_12860 [Gammaproteobacteria bacterium]|nr:hypothetical protein [Gammaproteobacteria bacterium]
MCGICGELRFDGTTVMSAVLPAMLATLERRGPDNQGVYSAAIEGGAAVALGHRRLAIIDLSSRADQPLYDAATGLVLVFNGTIYNYPQLRKELQALGHHFTSSGDSEVIIKAYAAWGEQAVSRLQGMFAFAIWDIAKQQLFLARPLN